MPQSVCLWSRYWGLTVLESEKAPVLVQTGRNQEAAWPGAMQEHSPLYTSDLALRVGRRRGSFEFPKIWFHLTHSYGLIP